MHRAQGLNKDTQSGHSLLSGWIFHHYFIPEKGNMTIMSHIWAQVEVGLSHGPIKEIRWPEMIHWLIIDITSGKNIEGRMLLSGRKEALKEWGRKEVERVIIEKTKALLSRLWQHPLHQVSPPIPPLWASHPIPSTQGNFLHSFITHLSLYSSLFTPTNGKNNTQ